MPDKENKWLVVWYDCCVDDDMDDEDSYAVRINADVLSKLYLEFKYVKFPYEGIINEWKRQSWTGAEVTLSTPTAKLSGYYGDGKTVADIPDVTKWVIATAIGKAEYDLQQNVSRLKELKKARGSL